MTGATLPIWHDARLMALAWAAALVLLFTVAWIAFALWMRWQRFERAKAPCFYSGDGMVLLPISLARGTQALCSADLRIQECGSWGMCSSAMGCLDTLCPGHPANDLKGRIDTAAMHQFKRRTI